MRNRPGAPYGKRLPKGGYGAAPPPARRPRSTFTGSASTTRDVPSDRRTDRDAGASTTRKPDADAWQFDIPDDIRTDD
jgi:hypothetical protein